MSEVDSDPEPLSGVFQSINQTGDASAIDYKEKYYKYKKLYMKEKEVNKELARRNVELLKCKEMSQAILNCLNNSSNNPEFTKLMSDLSVTSGLNEILTSINVSMKEATLNAQSIIEVCDNVAINKSSNKSNIEQNSANANINSSTKSTQESSSQSASAARRSSTEKSIVLLPADISGPTASSGVGKSRARRASTLAIRSSLGSGTSLTRKSTDVSSQEADGNIDVAATGSASALMSIKSVFNEISSEGGNGFTNGEGSEGSATRSPNNENSDYSNTLNRDNNITPSKSEHAEKEIKNPDMDYTPHLFEHFIVVGPAIEAGVEYSVKLSKQNEESSSVSRLLRGVSSILKGIGSDDSEREKGDSDRVASPTSASAFFSNSAFSFKSINLSMNKDKDKDKDSSSTIFNSPSSNNNATPSPNTGDLNKGDESSSSKYFSIAMSSAKQLFDNNDKGSNSTTNTGSATSITPERPKEKGFSFSLFGTQDNNTAEKGKEKEGLGSSVLSNSLKYLSGSNSGSRSNLAEVANATSSAPVPNNSNTTIGKSSDVSGIQVPSSDHEKPLSISSASSTSGANVISPSSTYSSTALSEPPKSLITNFNESCSSTITSVLYRYPENIERPPDEVCDFCLPLGGKLRRIIGGSPAGSSNTANSSSAAGAGGSGADIGSGTIIQEILYGQGQSRRSGRCFIFTLEDRTLESSSSIRKAGCNADSEKTRIEEEYGIEPGKLYGICVVHPRLLLSTPDGPIHPQADPSTIVELEAQVCFAFVTRFPLFEFFFQVILDMIHADRRERAERMLLMPVGAPGEGGLGESAGSLAYDPARLDYEYLPSNILQKVLHRLSFVKAPKFNEEISFHVWPADKTLPTITKIREKTVLAVNNISRSEYELNAAEWSLPVLFSWIPPSYLMWLIGLLLTETKIVVIGSEPGLVSCAIMGLLSLLKPFAWVMPIIPVLPSKHMDFVESPVPILGGVVIEPSTNVEKYVEELIYRCNDAENGTTTAIFDITNKEIFMSSHHFEMVPQLLLPGAENLVDRLKFALQDPGGKALNYANVRAPTYAIHATHKQAARRAQQVVLEYLDSICIMANAAKDRFKLLEYYRSSNDGSYSAAGDRVRTSSGHSEDDPQSRDSLAPINASESLAMVSKGGLIKLSDFKIEALSESSYLDSFLKRFINTQLYSEYCSQLEANDK